MTQVADVVAVTAIREHGIVDATIHPSAVDFKLGDGRTLTFYPGGDYPDVWELVEAAHDIEASDGRVHWMHAASGSTHSIANPTENQRDVMLKLGCHPIARLAGQEFAPGSHDEATSEGDPA